MGEPRNYISQSSMSAESDIRSLKDKQLAIILKSNPANNDVNTWIRSSNDIVTYREAIDNYGGIDDITPDYKANDVRRALESGEITVYSSYEIKNGVFVTPSRMEAQSYAGTGKIYSKTVKLTDVAWIDEIQGQFAKVNRKRRKA